MENQHSVVVVPSRRSFSSRAGESSGGLVMEETEIAATVSVPHDGGWGWLVVACAFLSLGIMDGIVFTFGSLLVDISNDMRLPEPMVALINSISMAVYFMAAPLVSGLINRFGFRAAAMAGSIISSISFCCSYFSKSYLVLCLFYGVCAGMGFSLINMACTLVVGFYFERKRAIAMAITTAGSGIGVLTFSRFNIFLVSNFGWRLTTLLHCGLLSIIIFLSMSFRPLVSVAVRNKADEPTRTVTFLPTAPSCIRRSSNTDDVGMVLPTVAQRFFGAHSNVNYPTSAAVVEESVTTNISSAGPSNLVESALAVTAYGPEGSEQHLTFNKVRSMTSRSRYGMHSDDRDEEEGEKTPLKPVKKGWWKLLFHWEPHVRQSRPLYRDDAFYDGRVTKLSEYEKSILHTIDEERTGLEYQMEVSRAAGTDDLHEKHGLCTTALRRVLATMLDPALLKRPSFIFICLSGMCTYLGVLVPYVYLQERNRIMGVDPAHNSVFISALGLSNSIGRISLGVIANKISSLKLMWITLILAGLTTTASHISYSVHFQYLYCFSFGFCIAGFSCLKSATIVALYGLDKLTNASGIILMFQGIGSLVGTPLAGVIMVSYGFTASFVVAGCFIALSGILLIPANPLVERENIILSNA